MQPWGELMSACGDELWDIGEGGTGGKDGKESAVTYTSRGVWTCKAQWGHMQHWAALLDPAICASLSECCAYHTILVSGAGVGPAVCTVG